MVATVAPVVGSLVLWAVTHSPYVLMFALLGPLVAVSSLGDTAIQGRRARRGERRRFAAEAAQVHDAIEREHAQERARRVDQHRDARRLMAGPRRDAERWRGGLDRDLPVVVGTGSVTSAIVLHETEGTREHPEPDEFTEQLESLRASASTLHGAPVVVDARRGLGIYGTTVLASAVARGITLQLAAALSPAEYEIVVPRNNDSDWLAALPHDLLQVGSYRGTVVFRHRERRAEHGARRVSGPAGQPARDVATISIAESAGMLPRECRVLLRVDGVASCEVLPCPDEAAESTVVPEFVSREQASLFATVLSEAASADGLVGDRNKLPDIVEFASLCPDQHAAAGELGRGSLACIPVQGVAGPLALDLVRDGPHAIVGGTTGSGKSEFLVAWILSMAARFGPEQVTFLLVDFKGGSSFHAVQQLPHSVGLITDLDEHSARRALASLRAELRFRERALAEAGVRSIEQLGSDHPLARLVIVVDEFAAMVQDFPDLHELFADIAARGRSLGVHLILCTQRPSGAIRDAVLANCTLRISLRVNNAADSTAVLGNSAAAELPRLPVGRALVSLGGESPQAVQVGLVRDVDVRMVDRRWRSTDGGALVQPRRPWCDPLPPLIPLNEVLDRSGRDGLVFGMLDLPEEQRTASARFDPKRDGSLIAIGGQGSGKSGVLASLYAAYAAEAGRSGVNEHGAVVLGPGDHERAWDTLTGALAEVRSGSSTPRLLLIDDLDALLGSLPEEYSLALTEAVIALLREGGRVGTHLVVTARRLGSSLQPIAGLCDSRLLLRLPDRHEHVAAGGEAAEFDAELTAGGGHWRGHRVQVAFAPIPPSREVHDAVGSAPDCPAWEGWPGWAIVTARPAELARRLAEGTVSGRHTTRPPAGWEVTQLGARPTTDLAVTTAGRGAVFIADAETWQSQWSLLVTVKTMMPVVFDRCGTADFRALTRARALPPLISSLSEAVWILTPDGAVKRRLPPWAGSHVPE